MCLENDDSSVLSTRLKKGEALYRSAPEGVHILDKDASKELIEAGAVQH